MIIYNENGETVFKGYYKNDILYSEDEQTPFSGNCIANNINGNKLKERKYKNGKLQKDITWHKNGQIQQEQTYNDNIKEGVWKWWYENGQKMREKTYVNNALNGKWEFWHENGQKIYEAEYKNNQETKPKRWNSKGKRLWFK